MTNIAITPKLKREIFEYEYEIYTNFQNEMDDTTSALLKPDHTIINDKKLISMERFPHHYYNNVRGKYDDSFFHDLDQILEWFKQRNSYCAVGVIPSDDKIPFINKLTNKGFKLGSFYCYWINYLDQINPIQQSDSIQPVGTDQEDEFVSTVLNGFELEPNSAEGNIIGALLRSGCKNTSWEHFIYKENNQSIGASSATILDDFMFLGNEAALPGKDRQRIIKEMINKRIDFGRSNDAKYAFTITGIDTELALIYQEMGFQVAMITHNYIYSF